MTMNGLEALKIIAAQQTNEVVVTTMSTAREWPPESPKELHLPLIGAMGKASSIALGVALGAPDRKVLVLDGEGSLLMNLGALVTVAAQAPKNFVHILFDNAAYDSSGGQPVPNPGAVDFPTLAKSAGYRDTYTFENADEFRAALPEILEQDGPIFVSLKVAKGWARLDSDSRTTAQAMQEVAAELARRPVQSTSTRAPAPGH